MKRDIKILCNFTPFKKAAENDSESAQIYRQLKTVMDQKSLFESLMDWIGRTPIMGSKFGSEEDSVEVEKYVEAHLEAHRRHGESVYGNSISEQKISERLRGIKKKTFNFWQNACFYLLFSNP